MGVGGGGAVEGWGEQLAKTIMRSDTISPIVCNHHTKRVVTLQEKKIVVGLLLMKRTRDQVQPPCPPPF